MNLKCVQNATIGVTAVDFSKSKFILSLGLLCISRINMIIIIVLRMLNVLFAGLCAAQMYTYISEWTRTYAVVPYCLKHDFNMVCVTQNIQSN